MIFPPAISKYQYISLCAEVIVLSFLLILSLCPHQCAVIAEQVESVGAVLLSGRAAALLLVDRVSFGLRQAEEAADHAQVLPQCSVLRARVLFPAQQLTQPALRSNHTHTHTHLFEDKLDLIGTGFFYVKIHRVCVVFEHSDAQIYGYELMRQEESGRRIYLL